MGRLARESVDKVRETVWVVNTRYDTVSDLVKKMQDTVDTMLRGQVTHSLKKVVEQPDLVLSMETRRNIYLMFKESLHNVLKHASASTVGIELTVRGDELRFRVSDDGVGFDAAVVTDGSGQDLLRRRAALCNGSVHVTSAPGKGTTIEGAREPFVGRHPAALPPAVGPLEDPKLPDSRDAKPRLRATRTLLPPA